MYLLGLVWPPQLSINKEHSHGCRGDRANESQRQQSGPYHNKKAPSRPFPMPLLSRQREMPEP
jgi:hypothetical protein